MARPLSELQALLKGLNGVQDAYVQPPTSGMQYPCIMIERDLQGNTNFADNIKYMFMKRYTITVMDRDPYSLIPDQVEGLPHSEFNRSFKRDSLNHFVFQMFF